MALKGVRVLEIAGLAPAPFAGMILADFGADVIRVDRTSGFNIDKLSRGKRSIGVNLKSPEGVALLLRLIEQADVLIEPFRPGVMERLGLGPDVCCKRNAGLIYARLTGFGQDGYYAPRAGHDINYVAVTGLLSTIGRAGDNPMFPGNMLADFAGGGLMCALGVVMALMEKQKSGRGQVIDVAMCDGTAYIGSFIIKAFHSGLWPEEKGTGLLDSGAPFYETYRTKDGKYMSVGAIEPQFYAELLKGLEIDPTSLPEQLDQDHWPATKKRFAAVFATKTRDEWAHIFDSTDSCVVPILGLEEAAKHPHNTARKSFIDDQDGEFEPIAAPRLSRTPGTNTTKPMPVDCQHTVEVLREFGVPSSEIVQLVKTGAVKAAEASAKM